ncbi:MAG: aromatic amino acid ammonia-lyase [Pseudomonadota bacterium]
MANAVPRLAEGRPQSTIVIDCEGLTLVQAAAIAMGERSVALSAAVRDRMDAARWRLDAAVESGRPIYGVSTGFGPLAGRAVPVDAEPRESSDAARSSALQTGLVYHLATGVGPSLDWVTARAVVVARLSALARGYSGASEGLIGRLVALLNAPVAPAVPSKGTVGASGDLTPLAHVALALMGEGRFIDHDGALLGDAEAFAQMRSGPLAMTSRDGLALVNGTAAMTGIAALNAIRAARLLAWQVRLSFAFSEILGGRREALHPALARARPHPGQIAVTDTLAVLAARSARLRDTAMPQEGAHQPEAPPEPLQDAYTLRCVPQVLGAVADTLRFHDDLVERELNGVSDNPIFPAETAPHAVHGGNFMGQHVAAASDALSTAVVTMAGLAERQVARLTDERLNGGLPPFLCRGIAGAESGLMGAQVTATALLAEMRTRSVPASIQSISTNGANQDVVSMGTIAARNGAAQITDASRILAILALAVAQGIDIVGEDGFAPESGALQAAVRRLSPPLLADRPLAEEIEALADHLLASDPPALANAAVVPVMAADSPIRPV